MNGPDIQRSNLQHRKAEENVKLQQSRICLFTDIAFYAEGKILSAKKKRETISPKSQTYKRRVVFEHYLSKSQDRFYRSGYNLLCSNISGRRNICHSVRAPLC